MKNDGNSISPIKDGCFRGRSEIRDWVEGQEGAGAKKTISPKISHTYPTMMAQLYLTLKKI